MPCYYIWGSKPLLNQSRCSSRPLRRNAMRCPFCGANEDKVLDSREAPDGSAIKRRRECKHCSRRFTTFEQIEEMLVYVVKSDGRREPFNREKILSGMRLASTGRPVSHETLEEIEADIE